VTPPRCGTTRLPAPGARPGGRPGWARSERGRVASGRRAEQRDAHNVPSSAPMSHAGETTAASARA
jgi:hypothetical protein